MRAVTAVALNTFKEAVRKKHLYVLALVAVILIGFSSMIVFFNENPEAFTKELSLFTISFLGMLVVVFTVSPQVRREMDDRSVYLVLSKPVGRFGYISGKFIGSILVLALGYSIFSLIFYMFILLKGIEVTGVFLHALLLGFLQLCIVGAVAMFLSTLFTSAASATLTVMYFLAQYMSSAVAFPLSYFNINWTVVHNVMPVPLINLVPLIGMGIMFILCLIFLCTAVFAQKEL